MTQTTGKGGNNRDEITAAWSHLSIRRHGGAPGGASARIGLPDMGRNDLITLAAAKRIDAMALLIDIAFLETIASEMTPGGISTVGGTHTDQDLEDIRRGIERRFRRQPTGEAA